MPHPLLPSSSIYMVPNVSCHFTTKKSLCVLKGHFSLAHKKTDCGTSAHAGVPLAASGVPFMLSGYACCPAACTCIVSMLSSVSLAFPFGFFATGGGTLTPTFWGSVALRGLGTDVSSARFFFKLPCATGKEVSITTFFVLFEKTKLPLVVGDLWRSKPCGDVGECKLRRQGALSLAVLAAVLKRIASCSLIEGVVVVAGGDFLVGEVTMAEVGGRLSDGMVD